MKLAGAYWGYLPLVISEPNTCDDFKLECPLVAGKTYGISKTGDVWYVPTGFYTMRIAVNCKDFNDYLFCVEIPFGITPIKTIPFLQSGVIPVINSN